MRYIIYFKFLTIVLATFNAFGNNTKFYHLSKSNGLSNNEVKCIFKDSRDFMWFGTEDGLNKFDGYNFTVYKSYAEDTNSLSGNYITAIVEDKYGNLWLGTDNGLNKFNFITETFSHYNFTDNINRNNNWISNLIIDHKGYLWISNDFKFQQFNTNTNSYEDILKSKSLKKIISKSTVSYVFEDRQKNIWIGIWNDGLYKLSENRENVVSYPYYSNNKAFQTYLTVSSIYYNNNEIWVGTINKGLFKVNNTKSQLDKISNVQLPNEISSIISVGNNELWLGQEHSITVINTNTFQITGQYINTPGNALSFTPGRIQTVYKDNTNIIWYGTGVGITYTDPNRDKFSDYYKQIDSQTDTEKYYVTCFNFEKQNNAWIGTFGKGLFYYNALNNSYTKYANPQTPLASNYINCITQLSSGMLYIGTLEGISIFDPDKKVVVGKLEHLTQNFNTLYHNSVQKIYEDSKQNIWITTQESLDLIEGEQYKHFTKYDLQGLSHYKITDILEDSYNNIWIATDNGLNMYNPVYKTIQQFKHNANSIGSISSSDIVTLFEDSDSILWIGTRKGLNYYNKQNKTFAVYELNERNRNSVIYKITEDKNKNLWLVTALGLSKLNKLTGTIKNYDENDGININKQCFYSNSDGELIIGGLHTGYYKFNPNNINDNIIVPKIYITKLLLFNKPVTVEPNNKNAILQKDIAFSNKITLKYDQTVLGFEFTALNYTLPEKNQFAYMLEGFDKNWTYIEADKRFITYTNLYPGTYTLKIKGSNNDGVWNQQGASLKITILPPFWRTTLAYIIYFVFCVILLITFRFISLARYKIKTQNTIEKLQAKQLHEIDELKINFFANISHEFRTPLTLILSPINRILQLAKQQNETKIIEQANIVQRNAIRLTELTNQLLDIQKLEARKMKPEIIEGNFTDFLAKIVAKFEPYAQTKQIILKYNVEIPINNAWFDFDKTEKIISNLISNAIKFTKSYVEVIVFEHNQLINIEVKDNGHGITPEQMPRIFDRFYQIDASSTRMQEGSGIGLYLVKELVELLSGKISVNSQVNEGTSFYIQLPYKKEQFKDYTLRINNNITEVNEYSLSHSITLPNINNETISPPNAPLVLIVEDNTDLRLFLKSTLAARFKVIEAVNGNDGIKKAFENNPDLIISDVMMPEMDGIEMISQLKTDSRTSHIPTILLTARDSDEYRIKGLETGAFDYITKPFNDHILLLKIENILHNQSVMQQFLRKKFDEETIINNWSPKDVVIANSDSIFLTKLKQIVEDNIPNTEFDVEQMAALLNISSRLMSKKISILLNTSPLDLLSDMRLKRAKQLLSQKELNISEIAFMCGFADPKYFSRWFKKNTNLTPSQFIEQL